MQIHPNQLIKIGLAAGVIMMSLAIVWITFYHEQSWLQTWYPWREAIQEISLGAAIGGLAMLLAWRLTELVPAFRLLREKLIAMLDFNQVTPWHALAFGLMAGIPEEMLFRGAIQPELGLLLTALLFGVLHAMSATYFLYATAAGFGLGLLAMWRDNLWAATTAHLIYDAGLFLLMRWHVQRNTTIIEA